MVRHLEKKGRDLACGESVSDPSWGWRTWAMARRYVRRVSLAGRGAASISIWRFIRHSLGLKAPRGWGWLTNPKRAAYNRVYYRTSLGLGPFFRGLRGKKWF